MIIIKITILFKTAMKIIVIMIVIRIIRRVAVVVIVIIRMAIVYQ